VVDGADGGDANGKFTWTPRPGAEQHATGGDFQKYEDGDDAEWYGRFQPDDGYFFIDDQAALAGHLYSLHGAGHRGVRTWAEDTFDNRTTSGMNMGRDPTGYGYRIGSSVAGPPDENEVFVDGAGGGVLQVNHFLGGVQVEWGSHDVASSESDTLRNLGQRLWLYDQWAWSGRWEYTADGGIGPSNAAYVRLVPIEPSPDYVDVGQIEFDLIGGTWTANLSDGTTETFDISAWFGVGAVVGFRIEVKRYVVRIRVWDASGAEPSTWDVEDHLYLDSSVETTYPYDDDNETSAKVTTAFRGLRIDLGEQDGIPLHGWPIEIKLRHLKIEHDPYGDPMDMGTLIESPEGTPRGEIVVPFGAHYFVYWGHRAWVGYSEDFEGYYLDFSAKVWNYPFETNAEIQRAEAAFWWFLYVPGGVVSMNWRSGQRPGQGTRVLVGR
jgi:hypothetical protein